MQTHNDRLALVESVLGKGPFFNGVDFSLVDAAYAPLFMRLQLLARCARVLHADRLPELSQWSTELSKLPAVTDSVVAEFPQLYEALIRRRGSYLSTLLPPGEGSPPAAKSRY